MLPVDLAADVKTARHSRARGRWALAFHVSVVALAGVVAILPFPSTAIEAVYSVSWYPRVQHVLTPLSNGVPFALFDVLVVAALGLVVFVLVRGWRRARRERRVGPVVLAVWHIVVAAATLYLVFLTTWGFNYRRVPMQQRLLVDPGAPDGQRVVRLGLDAVAQMNALHRDAHATGWRQDPWTNDALRAGFAVTQRVLSDAPPAVPGRLKRTMFGPYFRWTGVDGMVDPFALEVLANPDLLPWERPFVTAHEWAHLAGFADESEANFLGWLTCLHADVAAQYSAWLYIYWEVASEVSGADRGRLAAALDGGPRQDVTAIVERLQRGQLPTLRTVSWLAYDQYLKANRVEEGIRSYGLVVTLILQAKFEDGWTPVPRVR